MLLIIILISSHFVTCWEPFLNKSFCIDVTFEMRTVWSEIRLFNDNPLRHRHHIYMKRNEGKECKIAERQRERVCVREGAWYREEVARAVGET
jgi:hypothetical protein